MDKEKIELMSKIPQALLLNRWIKDDEEFEVACEDNTKILVDNIQNFNMEDCMLFFYLINADIIKDKYVFLFLNKRTLRVINFRRKMMYKTIHHDSYIECLREWFRKDTSMRHVVKTHLEGIEEKIDFALEVYRHFGNLK